MAEEEEEVLEPTAGGMVGGLLCVVLMRLVGEYG